MKSLFFILAFLPGLTFGQKAWSKLIDSLKFVTDMPYMCEDDKGPGCGDKIFWNVVKHRRNIIDPLIDKLTDTTSTKANVVLFGGFYTVADVAYSCIERIIPEIPTFELLGVEFDKQGCGYCSYWTHLRKDIRNRKNFQMAVRAWYLKKQ